jgi:UDP-glucose 4-epimerase
MRILVTGGAGALGRYFVARAAGAHDITVFDRVAPAMVDESVHVVTADISDADALESALQGVDLVISLAAEARLLPDERRMFEANVIAPFNVLEAMKAAGVTRLIHASSICAYGAIFHAGPLRPTYLPIDEDHPLRPEDAYGMSKLMDEVMIRSYADRLGWTTCCLRFASVWIPEADFPFVAKFVRSITDVALKADRYWAYVDVRDVAAALLLTVEHLAGHAPGFLTFNISAGGTVNADDAVESARRYYPDAEMRTLDPEGQPDAPLYSISKAQRVLGYDPRHTWEEYTDILDD